MKKEKYKEKNMEKKNGRKSLFQREKTDRQTQIESESISLKSCHAMQFIYNHLATDVR